MNEALAAAAALELVERLLPIIEERVKSGQVSPEDQTKLRSKYEALRAKADAAFTGPEWAVEK